MRAASSKRGGAGRSELVVYSLLKFLDSTDALYESLKSAENPSKVHSLLTYLAPGVPKFGVYDNDTLMPQKLIWILQRATRTFNPQRVAELEAEDPVMGFLQKFCAMCVNYRVSPTLQAAFEEIRCSAPLVYNRWGGISSLQGFNDTVRHLIGSRISATPLLTTTMSSEEINVALEYLRQPVSIEALYPERLRIDPTGVPDVDKLLRDILTLGNFLGCVAGVNRLIVNGLVFPAPIPHARELLAQLDAAPSVEAYLISKGADIRLSLWECENEIIKHTATHNKDLWAIKLRDNVSPLAYPSTRFLMYPAVFDRTKLVTGDPAIGFLMLRVEYVLSDKRRLLDVDIIH